MQSEGSSYGPSARDGGLLDSMKTLKISKLKPPVLRGPPPPTFPTHSSQSHLTLLPLLQHNHMPPSTKKNTSLVWLYSLPEGACCRDTELNWNKTITISRSTLTRPRSLTEKIQETSIWRLVSFSFTISFTAIQGTALKNSSHLDVRTNLSTAPPEHLFLSYCNLFVTSWFLCIVHQADTHSPQHLPPFSSLSLSLPGFLRPFGVLPDRPNTSF